jgi:hypothetical protein
LQKRRRADILRARDFAPEAVSLAEKPLQPTLPAAVLHRAYEGRESVADKATNWTFVHVQESLAAE